MPKVLGKAGESLADAYDVEGSVAGIEELETRSVPIVHDLSHTLFMERMQARIFVMTTGARLQSAAFAIALAEVTASPARIVGVTVQVDVTSRMSNINLCIRDPTDATEMPLWVWDETNEDTIRMDDGTATADQIVLRPSQFYNPLPCTAYGTDLRRHVNEFRLRGNTSAFGAGEVTALAQIYMSFVDARGSISSRGVPIPSW